MINGTEGNDTIYGSDADDEINALGGDDIIYGGIGADRLFGGAGNDRFVFDAIRSTSNTTPVGLIDGGSGTDTIDARAVSPTSLSVTNNAWRLTVGTQRFDVTGVETILLGDRVSTINVDAQNGSAVEVRAGNGATSAQLRAAAGTNTLRYYAEGGDDEVFLSGAIGYTASAIVDGGSGFDTLKLNILFTVDLAAGTAVSGGATFAISGFEEVQALARGTYGSTVLGSADADRIGVNALFDDGTGGVTFDGRGGNDRLTGSASADRIDGGDGDDWIAGRGGTDIMSGGSGRDTFEGTASDFGGDRITDFAHGDRIHVTDIAEPAAIVRNGETFTLGTGQRLVLNGTAGLDIVARTAADGGVEIVARDGRADHDFNGDGVSDILWRNGNGFLTTWWSTGASFNGASGVGETISADWKVAGNGDFDGDGISDVLWRNDNGALTMWAGTGTGFDGATGVNYFVGTQWKVAGVGDITGDGRDDIVWRTDGGAMTVWRASDAGFDGAAGYAYTLDAGWKIAGLGDFDGNGQDDVLWRNDNGLTTTWSAVGGGFVASSVTLPVGAEWKAAGVADFNGDGRDDILWRNDAGTITDWYATAGGGFTPNGFAAALGTNWQVEGTGDYDGDGRADILFRNNAGQIAEWLSRGAGFVPNAGVSSTVPADWDITV